MLVFADLSSEKYWQGQKSQEVGGKLGGGGGLGGCVGDGGQEEGGLYLELHFLQQE